MKKKLILNFVCPKLSGRGGTENVLTQVVNHFVEDPTIQVNLFLYNNPNSNNWLDKIDARVNLHIFYRKQKIYKLLSLIKCFNKFKKGVFIILNEKILFLAYQYRRFLLSKYRIVSWIHFSLNSDSNMLYLKKADDNWAISRAIYTELREIGVSDNKIKLIYNPTQRIQKVLPYIKSKNINLLYIGRLTYTGQKNLKSLFDAISNCKNVKLTIYGSGKDEDKLKNYANKLDIQNEIDWKGWTKDPWMSINTKPDALILTSKFEGMPMVVLEALARGIPVLTSRFKGYDDFLLENQNGLSFDVNNINDIVNKIYEIREKRMANSDQRIKNSISKFYVDNYFDRLDKIIEKYRL